MHPTGRGQGSFEYLMNYSWALLVIMVVGITLFQIGAINEGGASITSSGFTFFRLIQVMSEGKGGLVVLYFQNTLPEQITINRTATSVTYNPTGTKCVWVILGPEEVPAGGTFKIEAYSTDFQPCVPPAQDSIDVGINILYQTTISGRIITKGETGIIKGKQPRIDQVPNSKSDSPADFTMQNFNLKGVTCGKNGCATDYCVSGGGFYPPLWKGPELQEIYLSPCPNPGCPFCPTTDYCLSQTWHSCSNGCVDGACLP